MHLTPVMTRFILHWGEMGSRWGVNRTVAQIHALLYLAPGPLPADEIAETLNVARSNVSTSLKELQGWGLVSVAHVMSDRRDHFAARSDPWEMLVTIMEQRQAPRDRADAPGSARVRAGAREGSRHAEGGQGSHREHARLPDERHDVVRPDVGVAEGDRAHVDEARREGRELRPEEPKDS